MSVSESTNWAPLHLASRIARDLFGESREATVELTETFIMADMLISESAFERCCSPSTVANLNKGVQYID